MNFNISAEDIEKIIDENLAEAARIAKRQKIELMPKMLIAYTNTLIEILRSPLISAIKIDKSYNATLTLVNPEIPDIVDGRDEHKYGKIYWGHISEEELYTNNYTQQMWTENQKRSEPIYDKRLSDFSECESEDLKVLIDSARKISIRIDGYYKPGTAKFMKNSKNVELSLKEFLYREIPEFYEQHLLQVIQSSKPEGKFKI